MSELPFVIMADMAYRPLEFWAAAWNRPVTTIKTWISKGTCPAKKIGGVWMISQMELLNWAPPQTEDGKEESKKGDGGRKLRKAGGRMGAVAEDGGGPTARRPV